MRTRQFKVVAVSEEVNSLGMKEYIFVDRRGMCFKGNRKPKYAPSKGDVVNFSLSKGGFVCLVREGYSLPAKLPTVPAEAVKKFWKQ